LVRLPPGCKVFRAHYTHYNAVVCSFILSLVKWNKIKIDKCFFEKIVSKSAAL
jgi:hypothetical protein